MQITAIRRRALTDLTWQLALLAAIGLVAIGASGVIAESMRVAFGDRFVAGDPEGVIYTAERCADYLEYVPGAADCEAAASGHHADEVVIYRIAAGLMGVVVLAAWWWLRARRRDRVDGRSVAPDVVPAIGAAMFGAAAVVLGGQGLGVLVFEGPDHGPGQWISAGGVSLIAFVGFARAFWRTLPTAAS